MSDYSCQISRGWYRNCFRRRTWRWKALRRLERERDADTAVDVTAYTIHFPSKHRKIESPCRRGKRSNCYHSWRNVQNKIMLNVKLSRNHPNNPQCKAESNDESQYWFNNQVGDLIAILFFKKKCIENKFTIEVSLGGSIQPTKPKNKANTENNLKKICG